MYKQVLPVPGEIVTIYVDGKAVKAVEGTSVASAVLGSGVDDTRVSQVKHEPRGPFCLMGVCHECLMEIDGVANQRSCMTQVKANMRIRRQNGAPDFAADSRAMGGE